MTSLRLAVKIVLGVALLFFLTLAQQLVWTFLSDLRWKLAFSSSIWLFPSDTEGWRESPEGWWETDVSKVSLQCVAPLHEEIVLRVNGLEKARTAYSGYALRFDHIPLRVGFNEITAEVAQSGIGWQSPARMRILRRPGAPQESEIGRVEVAKLGANADAPLKYLRMRSSANVVVALYSPHTRVGEKTTDWIGALLETEEVSAERLQAGEVSPVPALRRKLRLYLANSRQADEERQMLHIEGELSVAKGTALRAWLDNGEISVPELLQHVFGIWSPGRQSPEAWSRGLMSDPPRLEQEVWKFDATLPVSEIMKSGGIRIGQSPFSQVPALLPDDEIYVEQTTGPNSADSFVFLLPPDRFESADVIRDGDLRDTEGLLRKLRAAEDEPSRRIATIAREIDARLPNVEGEPDEAKLQSAMISYLQKVIEASRAKAGAVNREFLENSYPEHLLSRAEYIWARSGKEGGHETNDAHNEFLADSPEHADWPGPVPSERTSCDVLLVGAAKKAAGPETEYLDFMGALKKLEERLPRAVRDPLTALLTAIPFLWLLWLLKTHQTTVAPDVLSNIRTVTVTFLLFHLLVQLLPTFTPAMTSLSRVTEHWMLESEPGRRLVEYWSNHWSEPDLGLGLITDRVNLPAVNPLFVSEFVTESMRELGNVSVMVPAFVLLLIPLYAGGQRPAFNIPAWRWILVAILSVAFPVLLLFGILGMTMRLMIFSRQLPGIEPLVWATLVVLFFALVWWLVGARIARALNWRSPMVFLAIVIVLLLPLAAPLIEWISGSLGAFWARNWKSQPILLPQGLDNTVWLFLLASVGALALYQVVRLLIGIIKEKTPAQLGRPRRSLLIYLALLLACLPFGYLLRLATESYLYLDLWFLGDLAMRLDRLLPYALLVAMIFYLGALNREDWFELPRDSVRLGALMFAYYLTGRTANVLFVPLPLLLGYFAFTRVVLGSSLPGEADLDKASARKRIRQLLDYKLAVQLSYRIRPALFKKFQDEALAASEVDTRVRAAENRLEEARSELQVPPDVVRSQIFNWGPENGPWANARNAVFHGLFISIPFQIVTLVGLLRTNVQEGVGYSRYPILELLERLCFSASMWILIAFLFGYFFHLIWGRDSFTKALVFSGAVLVPTIPQRLLEAQPLLGEAHKIQIFQVVIYVLFLALIAFDLRTVQKLGLTWHRLISIYGLGGITAYGSTIVAASIASITGDNLLEAAQNLIRLVAGGAAGGGG